jgi:hypothetical protein
MIILDQLSDNFKFENFFTEFMTGKIYIEFTG